jgi:hypothetical protein
MKVHDFSREIEIRMITILEIKAFNGTIPAGDVVPLQQAALVPGGLSLLVS